MRSLHISTGRSVLAAAAFASLVGCSDDFTAPTPTAPSTPPSTNNWGGVVTTARVTISVKNVWGSLVDDNVTIRFNDGSNDAYVTDGAYNDQDPTPGIISANMPFAETYTVCFQGSVNYGMPSSMPKCNTVAGSTFSDFKYFVSAGSLTLRKFPKVAFYMQDQDGNSIPGGKIELSAERLGYSKTAADGSPEDLSPAVLGAIVFRGVGPGVYDWCEETAPNGYYKTVPNCGTVSLNWDVDTALPLKHQKRLYIPLPK